MLQSERPGRREPPLALTARADTSIRPQRSSWRERAALAPVIGAAVCVVAAADLVTTTEGAADIVALVAFVLGLALAIAPVDRLLR